MRARSPSSSIRTTRSKRGVGAAKDKPRWAKGAVLRELESLADPRVRAKMEYFGVRVPSAHGISAPVLHALAKQIGKSHALDQELWATGIHEAQAVAALLGEYEKVTYAEMDRSARNFDSCDVVDAPCCYLKPQAKPTCNKVAASSRLR